MHRLAYARGRRRGRGSAGELLPGSGAPGESASTQARELARAFAFCSFGSCPFGFIFCGFFGFFGFSR